MNQESRELLQWVTGLWDGKPVKVNATALVNWATSFRQCVPHHEWQSRVDGLMSEIKEMGGCMVAVDNGHLIDLHTAEQSFRDVPRSVLAIGGAL